MGPHKNMKWKALNKESEHIKKATPESLSDEEIGYYNATIKPELDNLTAILKHDGYWGVAIDDADTASAESLNYLSTNQRIHVYKETPEEGLIQKYKEMMANLNPEKQTPQSPATAKGSQYKQWVLLSQNYVHKVLGYLIDLGPYFVHTKSFKLTVFYDDMVSSYGGILAVVCRKTLERLRMCFNAMPVSKELVDELEDDLKDPERRVRAREVLSTVLKKLASTPFIPEALTDTHLKLLDDAFDKHYDPTSVNSYQLGNRAFGFGTISAYRQDAIAAVRQAFNVIQEDPDVFKGLHNDTVTAMASAEQKIRLVLMAKWTIGFDYSDFPLFSRSLYSILRRNLKMIQRSLLEVSSWWSPYIRLSNLHVKDWMPGSASADMIQAILAHPAYDIDLRHNMVDNVIHMIFDSYSTFLHFEGQLASADIPTPPSRQNELEAMFGGDKLSKKSTNTKGKGKGKGKSTGRDEDDDSEDFFIDDDEDEEEYSPWHEERRQQQRELRRRIRQETAVRQKNLHAEMSTAATILQSARKVPLSGPTQFDATWSRASRLSDDTPLDLFRGQSTLAFHTFEWSASHGGSRARNMRHMARIVIYNDALVSYYRPALFKDPYGAASAIRYMFDTRLATFLDVAGLPRVVQSQISSSSFILPSSAIVVWPDGLKYNTIAATKQFSLDEELKTWQFVDISVRQTSDLQRIVNALTSAHVVSASKCPSKDSRFTPRIHDDVFIAVEKLIQTIQLNCYRQRHPEMASLDSYLQVPQSELLQISIRGISDSNGDNPDARDRAGDDDVTQQTGFILLSREELVSADTQEHSMNTFVESIHNEDAQAMTVTLTQDDTPLSSLPTLTPTHSCAASPTSNIQSVAPQSPVEPISGRSVEPRLQIEPPAKYVFPDILTQILVQPLVVEEAEPPCEPPKSSKGKAAETSQPKRGNSRKPKAAQAKKKEPVASNDPEEGTSDPSHKRGVSDTSIRATTVACGKKRQKQQKDMSVENTDDDTVDAEHQFV
ncbi:hypothetical protein JVU11DRAFT_12215 [Chiua virens]|nr:hypothetical protein JVU11DRAFT_12215 [Chiua virens]